MGNAITYRDNLRRGSVQRMSKALRSFIERECPIYLAALDSNDYKLRDIVVKQFNSSFDDYIFDNIYSILPHLERLRLNRVNQLNKLTSDKFDCLSEIKLSCLPCKINEYLTLAYFDTGCSISCITLTNARKLNLISLIDRSVKGVAVGFGCNRLIVGFLNNLPVQISKELLFNINFVVINQANADFILIGYDFLVKFGLKIDYSNGKIIFPQQIINEHKLDFIPNKSKERDLFFDLFKYEMLEQNRDLMRNYFCNNKIIKSKFNYSNNLQKQNSSAQCRKSNESTNNNLYMQVTINGKRLFALIDTGADTSKISDNLALQLDILRFVDYNKRQIGHGLGSVVSVGRIPPIPIKFESIGKDCKKLTAILFVSFEVLKENSVNLLLFGSDFFTYYNCYLDFENRSINIPLNPHIKLSLDEQNPKNINLSHNEFFDFNFFKKNCNFQNCMCLNDNEKKKNDWTLNVYRVLSYELNNVSQKINEKKKKHQSKKKNRKYKLLTNYEKQINFFKVSNCYQILSTALRALNNQMAKKFENIYIHLNEFNQTTSFLEKESDHFISESINNFEISESQPSIYCNGFLPEYEIKDSIAKINFID